MDGNFALVKFRGSLGLDSKIIYCERKWREGEKDPACKMDGLRTVKGKCFSLFFFFQTYERASMHFYPRWNVVSTHFHLRLSLHFSRIFFLKRPLKIRRRLAARIF